MHHIFRELFTGLPFNAWVTVGQQLPNIRLEPIKIFNKHWFCSVLFKYLLSRQIPNLHHSQ